MGESRPAGLGRRSLAVAHWAAPSVLLALMPKCPACLAAYVFAWTGLGLSLSVATSLRMLLLAAGVTWLAFLLARRVFQVAFAAVVVSQPKAK
jgi:hypothetical protein